jgi:hypothetical protein
VIRGTVVGKTDETFYELIAGSFYKLSVVTTVLIFCALLFNRIFSSKQGH